MTATATTTDRPVQLLPSPDNLRGQLLQLRTLVRRRDVGAAEALIETLIAQATSNGHPPTLKLPPLRKATKATCPFGWKYTAKGKQTRDRRHTCGPECSWTGQEALAWASETPYKIAPGVEILPRLVPVPPCTKCDRKRSDHWETVADDAGRFLGFRQIPECNYTPAKGAPQ